MSLALMLALQAAAPAAPAPAAPAPLAVIDFDLARLPQAEGGFALPGRACRSDDPATILVCARPRGAGAYPIDDMARLFMPRPIVAEMSLGGGATAALYGEQVGLDRGAVSNRFMFGIRLGF